MNRQLSPLGDFGVQARLDCVDLLRDVPRQPVLLHQPLTALPHYNVQQRVSKGGENRRRRHVVARRDPPTGGISKSGRPCLSRQEQWACCCSCFVDISRGGSSGNAPRLPSWQHKTVSRHKPRYHVSHDAIHRGKTSRCPLA